MNDKIPYTRLESRIAGGGLLEYKEVGIVNLNDYVLAGMYKVRGAGTDTYKANNFPCVESYINSGNSPWYLNVYAGASTLYCVQEIRSYDKPQYIFSRILNNGVWRPWYQISGPGLDMPSTKYIEYINQVQTTGPWDNYKLPEAPTNGYWVIRITAESTGGHLEYNDSPCGIYKTQIAANGSSFLGFITAPCYKGRIGKLYGRNATINIMRFVYANSEVPMNERTNFKW